MRAWSFPGSANASASLRCFPINPGDRTFIVSFLYYFGVLTLVGETPRGELALKVPNLVMQSLYVERVRRMMLPDPVIRDRGRLAAEKVYQEGDIQPVCAFVEDHLFTVFKNRDYAQANELTIKTAFLGAAL